MPRPRTLAWLGLLALASALTVLLGYTGRDDSHITYFVADRLASGHGLVNLLGERQEQSSSLLYSMLLAGLVKLTGLPAASLGPWLSGALLVPVGVATASLARRCGLPALAASAACLTPPLFYWSLSGMENSLYLLLLVSLLAALADPLDAIDAARVARVALAAALATLTRPEAMFVLACLAACLLGDRWMRAPRLGLVVLASIAGAVALRLALGLDLFPASVYAKQQIDLGERVAAGYTYLASTAWHLPASTVALACVVPACIVGAWHVGVSSQRHRIARLTLALGTIVGAFALLSGGDWMEVGRFLAPTYFCATLAALVLVPARWSTALATVILLASSIDLALVARAPYGGASLLAASPLPPTHYTPSGIERFNTVHARDLPFIDRVIEVLQHDARPSLHVASIQGGMVPYYASRALGDRVRFVELYGLTSRRTQACISHWQWDPYGDLRALSTCLGTPIDYVFDLDDPVWSRVGRLYAQGCDEVFRDERIVQPVAWKAPLHARQFLVRCGPHATP